MELAQYPDYLAKHLFNPDKIGRPDVNVSYLAERMGRSRAGLYRLLKATALAGKEAKTNGPKTQEEVAKILSESLTFGEVVRLRDFIVEKGLDKDKRPLTPELKAKLRRDRRGKDELEPKKCGRRKQKPVDVEQTKARAQGTLARLTGSLGMADETPQMTEVAEKRDFKTEIEQAFIAGAPQRDVTVLAWAVLEGAPAGLDKRQKAWYDRAVADEAGPQWAWDYLRDRIHFGVQVLDYYARGRQVTDAEAARLVRAKEHGPYGAKIMALGVIPGAKK